MPKSGYKGISFPFRVGPQGGVVMTTTSATDPTHIVESIKQIFGTHFLQRVMEPDVYSNLASALFEPNDETLQSIIKSRIIEALERLEERVETTEDNISFTVETTEKGEFLFATIKFKIIKYETWYEESFKVGEITNE